MTDLIRSSIGPSIELVLKASPSLPPAVADPNQLELAILNLCINARDAMAAGGQVTLTIEQAVVRPAAVPGLAAGEYIRLTIADTGTGMDAETLARAIEPFYSTKEHGRGTGLGLSMVHGLAAQLGGAFHLASTPGAGTTASLYLALAGADLLNLRPAPEITAEYQASPLDILLVDDEDVVREATTAMLRDMGHTVTGVGGGTEALDRLHNGLPPDLLITDFKMPRMSGAQLARQVREHWPTLPLLIITGYISDSREADDIRVLAKPFRQSDLASALFETMQATLS